MRLFSSIGSALLTYRSRREQRRRADDWLRSATGTFVPERYAWRAAELGASCNRRTLARTLRLIERNAFERGVGRVRPLNLVAVREHRQAVLILAERLETVDAPVTPAGMLRVVELVTDGASPLYGLTRGDELGTSLAATLAILEPFVARRAA